MKKFQSSKSPEDITIRAKYGEFAGWISIIVNVLLFGSKLVIGLLINSISLIADSIHSASDMATSVVVIVGYKISRKPADAEHPYGHQRAEYIATLIISILLIVLGFEFTKSAINRIAEPEVIQISYSILFFIVLTIVVKALLGSFSNYIGRLIGSQAVKADALHHYSDAISSVLVLIAVWGSSLGYPFLDGIGGILIGLLLIWVGFSIARGAANSILGKPPSHEFIHKIREICRSTDNVINAHDIVVHSYGNHNFISVHVEVDQKQSSVKAHEIADSVEKKIKNELGAYSTAHVDPVDLGSRELKRASALLYNLVEKRKDIVKFHDLRLVKKSGYDLILFDLVTEPKIYNKSKESECRNWFVKEIKEHFSDTEVVINIDPIYIID